MTALPPINSAKDNFGRNTGPREITSREIERCMIGREVSRDTWVDGQRRARLLRDQSEDFVRRLERIGIKARSDRDETTIVGLITGRAERATDYRNCNLIPVQQSKNVHDMFKHVQYLMEHTRPGRLRMLVVSAGWCRYDEYRKHHRAHTRRMSKFASHPKLKEFGISIEFYNVENTIHRDDVAMLNMHSHVLYQSHRKLGREKWCAFLEFARNFFPKRYVHDSKIEKPNEVVKYVFKPSEFDLLKDDELAEFWHQMVGGRPKFDPETGEIETRVNDAGETVDCCEGPLKFFHPYGSIKKMRRDLRERGQKLIKVQINDGRYQWRVTEPSQPEEKPEPNPDRSKENMVIAKTRPMPKFSPRMEPCVVVINYDGDFDRMVRLNGLQRTVNDAHAILAQRKQIEARAAREAAQSADEGASLSRTLQRQLSQSGTPNGGQAPPEIPPEPQSGIYQGMLQ